jgi:hypothetical protein
MLIALAEIRRVAALHPQIAAGYHVVPPKPELVGQRIDKGYRFIAYSTDIILFGRTAVPAFRPCGPKVPMPATTAVPSLPEQP